MSQGDKMARRLQKELGVKYTTALRVVRTLRLQSTAIGSEIDIYAQATKILREFQTKAGR